MAVKRSPARTNRPAAWREFEILVAAIEKRMAPKGALVKFPDRIRDLDTNRLREVDASIRFRVGSADVLVTIECRRRARVADVTWIEQLAAKREKLGAAKTIAVSPKGFSAEAHKSAGRYGIELRVLGEVTESDISNWFSPSSFIHSYRVVESIECEVVLLSGSTTKLDGLEPKFRHPSVQSPFPAAALLSFIELKNPDAFWSISLDGQVGQLEFVLDGQASDLVPVPLGEKAPGSGLDLNVGGDYLPVKRIKIRASVRYIAEALGTRQGKHFAYGPEGNPESSMSRYHSEMFGMPVQIERFLMRDQPTGSATITFPSGLQLPGKLANPKLTDISLLDTKRIHGFPISLKLFGMTPINGIIFDPRGEFFKSRKARIRFSKQYVMFLDNKGVSLIRQAAIENPKGTLFWDIVKIIPRETIEYIDFTHAIEALAKRKSSTGSS